MVWLGTAGLARLEAEGSGAVWFRKAGLAGLGAEGSGAVWAGEE